MMIISLIFLPLIASVFIWLFKNRLPSPILGWIGSFSVLISFVLGCVAFLQLKESGPFSVSLSQWIYSNGFSFSYSFLCDSLSILMVLMVTGIGALIHFYAIGYMHDDERFNSFFSYLTLFTFFMLVLVLLDNYFGMMIGWEGVVLCSYLLIGFWFKKDTANVAAFRAFIANRVGDLGFMLGVAAILMFFGTLNYDAVFAATPGIAAQNLTVNLGIFGWHVNAITLICLLLFAGAAGKSAARS